MPIDYTSWYENAVAELERVQKEKAALQQSLLKCDQQIVALTQAVNAIAPLVGCDALQLPPHDVADAAPGGMTESIRAVLTEAREPLTASEIRDRLEAKGFDVKSYSNPLANIHTILRRLSDAKAVETTHELNAPTPGGKRFSIAVGKRFEMEKLAGKSFEIGKLKGFVGVGRLKRRGRVD